MFIRDHWQQFCTNGGMGFAIRDSVWGCCKVEKDKGGIMGKHTPGPWKIVKDEELPGAYRIDGFYSQIEEAYESNDPQSVIAMNEEDNANAALIAAAPEMFAALKHAEAAFDARGFSAGLGSVLGTVKAAIAKAERK